MAVRSREKWFERMLGSVTVGVSVVMLDPEDFETVEWAYVNDARCRLTGHSREEILASSPMGLASGETRAQASGIVEQLLKHGEHRTNTTAIHKSGHAIPIEARTLLLRHGGRAYVLTESHDITRRKEVQARLRQAEENTRSMLGLLEKEKEQLRRNIEENVQYAVGPVLDQLRATVRRDQMPLVDMLNHRLRHITRELGVRTDLGLHGYNLTRRQIMICNMIQNGMPTKSIARALACSPSTVNNHRNTIRKKLRLCGTGTNLETFLNARPEDKTEDD